MRRSLVISIVALVAALVVALILQSFLPTLDVGGWVVFGSLLWALVLVPLSYLWNRDNIASLGDRMGAGKWEFSSSWASTLTAAGGILTTILSAQVLSSSQLYPISKEGLTTLSLLFTIIIVIAALVYNANRDPVDIAVPDPNAPSRVKYDTQYQGYVWAFLVASAMVVWAVIGQLATVLLLLYGLLYTQGTTLIPGFIFAIFTALTVAALFLANHYAWKSIPWTLRRQEEHRTDQEAQLKALRSAANPELRPWTLP
jgi:hypothetical protein